MSDTPDDVLSECEANPHIWAKAGEQRRIWKCPMKGHSSSITPPRLAVYKAFYCTLKLMNRIIALETRLRNKRADLSDTGCYLCEVNTEPLSTIYAVYLDVQNSINCLKERAEPATPAVPNRQRATRLMANMAGDEVLLNCTVSVGSEPVDDEVIWTRDGKEMNLNDTNKYIWKVKRSAGIIVHTVRIREATMEDDGNYACESKHQRASQIVHVNKAEAQRSSSNPLAALIVMLVCVVATQGIL
ncbi:immunoglobulin domain protein [Ancylostoma ceylanicum]|uniref:Immunoglobulin domain protein n=1 Tax=Ancylostoma ceylanicum TaxID=53326 RepID=A0A0D6M3P9_9BILA|nr:immunoglobulin domain protein [Ancylostoma ceylanicum]